MDNKPSALTEEIIGRLENLSREETSQFCAEITAVSIAILRGMHGDQYINDFLNAAHKDDLAVINKKYSN